ncbi:lectin-like domain-containing protein, partial [uncultured Weissella sp.]
MKNNKILSEADYIAKEHYKMYKAGKKWMVAGITAVSILGAVAMAEGTASADQVANTTSGTDPAVVKVDQTAVASQSATAVTLSASASVSSVASEVPAVTEVSASSEVASSVVASEAVSSSSDVESSVAPASVSASVEASSSVSASVTPVASVSASVESSSVVESVASSVAPVVNGHDSVAMSSMMSSAESAKAAGSIVTMRAVLAQATVSASTAGTIAKVADANNKAGSYGSYAGTNGATNDPHHLTVTSQIAGSYFTPSGNMAAASSVVAKDGTVALTNANNQTGAYAFQNMVDMTKNWKISFDIDLAALTHDQTIMGDFIGLGLLPVAPDKVATAGGNGGGLGIYGVSNAYNWGIDFWANNEKAYQDAVGMYKTTGIGGVFGIGSWDANYNVVGVRRTDGNGSMVAADPNSMVAYGTLSNTADQGSLKASNAADLFSGGTFSTPSKSEATNSLVSKSYNYKNTVTATFTANGDGTGTLNVVMGKYNKSFTVGTKGIMSMSVAVLSSTGGGAMNVMGTAIKNFDLQLATTSNKISYVDVAGNQLMDGTSMVINAGNTLTLSADGTTGMSDDGKSFNGVVPTLQGYKYAGYTVTQTDSNGTKTVTKIVRDGSTYKTIVTTTDKSGKSETNTTDGIQAVTLGNDATIVINYIAQATGVVTGVTSDGTKLTDVKTVQTDVNGTVADADSTLTFDSLPAVSGYLPVQKSFDLAEATTLTGLNQAVNVIYMVDATKAGDNHDVNVAKDSAVVKAAATLQTALASATTQDAVQKAVAAYDQAVQQAVADQTTAKTVAGNLASYPDNLTSTALTTAKQAVADAVAGLTDGSKSTDDLNKALTDYATAVQKAVTDDAAKLATTTEASDATVKADKATLDSKVADLTSALKSGDQTKINQATQAVTDAKNALDKAVQAAANTNANGVTDLKDANLTGLQTALQDATKAGTIADIAAKEASLVDGVKNTASTLLDQVTADQAAVTSANDDATKTAASDLDGAKVELQNVLAAVPAASVAAIVTAVKALDDKKRAYESAVKNAVTLNDDTKAVAGLAASDASVNTAVNALKKALTDGTLTDLATAESGLKSAINAAATAAGNTADAEQDVVAKMSVAKNADVTAAGTILDQKQAELATLVKSGTATSDEIAAAVTAVNDAKNDYDAKVIAAVKKNDFTDAVSAL